MLAIQLHRWRQGNPRTRNGFVTIVAALSMLGCGLGVALLQLL